MGEPIKETFATLVSLVKILVPFLRQMAEVSGSAVPVPVSVFVSVSVKMSIDLTTRRHRIRKASARTSLRCERSSRSWRI
jgi:hypothetical protein